MQIHYDETVIKSLRNSKEKEREVDTQTPGDAWKSLCPDEEYLFNPGLYC